MQERACKPPSTRTGKCLADFGYKFLREKSPGTRRGALTKALRQGGWTASQIKQRLRWLAQQHRRNPLKIIITSDLRWFEQRHRRRTT